MLMTTVGDGGWAQVIADDAPGPLYMRVAVDRGRPVLTELYVDGRGAELTPRFVRELPIAGLMAMLAQGQVDQLENSWDFAGPDLTRLASHFATNWGTQAKHWVAESWRAQIKGSGVPQAPMARIRQLPADDVSPGPLESPSDGLTDRFLQRVAECYSWAVGHSTAPARELAEQAQVSPRTIHRWVYEARRRGIMPRTTQGRRG